MTRDVGLIVWELRVFAGTVNGTTATSSAICQLLHAKPSPLINNQPAYMWRRFLLKYSYIDFVLTIQAVHQKKKHFENNFKTLFASTN